MSLHNHSHHQICRMVSRSDEKGSVLLVTVFVLLILSLIGVSGINTASMDLQITRNYRVHKENLMLADAAVNRASTIVMNAIDDNIVGRTWVNNLAGVYLVENLMSYNSKYIKDAASYNPFFNPVTNRINVPAVIADWNNGTAQLTPASLPSQPNTQYIAYLQLSPGDPVDRTASAVVIARSRVNGGNVIIEAGIVR